jgi:hypothetical protein
MAPDGLGIYLRQPALLKYLFHLRGSHIEQTPFFNKHIYSEDQQGSEEENKLNVEDELNVHNCMLCICFRFSFLKLINIKNVSLNFFNLSQHVVQVQLIQVMVHLNHQIL